MKVKLALPIGVLAAIALACSFFSNEPRPDSQEPFFSTETHPATAAIEPTQPDDGSRYLIYGCGMQYGYINRQGNLMIPHQFSQAGHFHEGLAVAGSIGVMNRETFEFEDGKYGYIDTSGRYMIEPKFPGAGIFSEGLAIAASPDNSKLFGYIDRTGAFVIEPQYFGSVPVVNQTSIDSKDFHEGYAVVPKPRQAMVDDFLVMYIDKTGNVLTPPGAVRAATYFSNGLALIQTDLETNIIDTNGHTVAQIANCNYNSCHVGPFSEGLASIERNTGIWTQKGFIDKTGSIIIEEQFNDVKPFSNGLAAVTDAATNLWGYINPASTLVIPYQYITAGNFSEGLAAVTLPDMSGGYIDKTAKMVITFKDMQSPFSGDAFWDGLAPVADGYIDRTGDFVYKTESTHCP